MFFSKPRPYSYSGFSFKAFALVRGLDLCGALRTGHPNHSSNRTRSVVGSVFRLCFCGLGGSNYGVSVVCPWVSYEF